MGTKQGKGWGPLRKNVSVRAEQFKAIAQRKTCVLQTFSSQLRLSLAPSSDATSSHEQPQLFWDSREKHLVVTVTKKGNSTAFRPISSMHVAKKCSLANPLIFCGSKGLGSDMVAPYTDASVFPIWRELC